ncbi:3' exoribonuclease [Serratia phage vB_SmaM-Kashira]|nr:3' exoribonuclease [Serratia phage vB_SmaM-Kashira]
MAKNHLMLDIETLDLKPTAAVLSIAATLFDPLTGELGESFNKQINLKSCTDLGLTVDPSTIMWWMEQSKEAQDAFKGNNKAQSLSEVLVDFHNWVNLSRSYLLSDGESSDFCVWGNGKDFDCVIVENAYRAAGIKHLRPWAFWETMDVRTLVQLGVMAGTHNFKKMALDNFKGVKHNALDDVQNQIKYVVQYTQALVGKGGVDAQ